MKAIERGRPEQIFNLYYVIEQGVIRQRALMKYERRGTDQQKMAFLQSVCRADAPRAKRFPVPSGWVYIDTEGRKSAGITWDTYQQTVVPRYGDIRWFEDIFQAEQAPQQPLVLITCIVDGEVRIEGERQVV